MKRILVGLGGTDYSPIATRVGVELGKRHQAEVNAVTVFDPRRLAMVGPVPIGGAGAAQDLRDLRRKVTRERVSEAVDMFNSACENEKLSHQVWQETGDSFSQIVAHSRYHDVTVFGLRSIFDWGLDEEFEDPAGELCKLLTAGVRPIIAVTNEYHPVHRVLVAYSGSMESAKTLRSFLQRMPREGLAVKIVHFADRDQDGEQLLQDAAAYCKSWGVEVETVLRSGSPRSGLLPFAKQCDADLIVLGNSARSLLLRRVLGDTVLEVIQNADRPLFLSQ